jgi:hypothetical protein
MKIFFKACCVFVASAFAFSVQAQYQITVLDSTTFQVGEGVVLSKTSFRGLSVVDDDIIWVSGSRGTVARSVNGGKSFEYKQLKGYEKSDFRDIEAFDDKRAIIMSSGTPAYILKTVDGGQSWKEVYKNTDSAYFLDAMDFWDEQQGVVVGDPIGNKFVILSTYNGGESWKQDTEDPPVALDGEAIFAASGTSVRYLDKFSYAFVTGGKHSRIIQLKFCHPLPCWIYQPLQIVHGKNSTGAFSFTVNSTVRVIVGGDYLNDTCVRNNSEIAYRSQTNAKYNKVFSEKQDDVKGYRSCVESITKKSYIACGTSGVDLYKNRNWKTISDESFHVICKAKKGKAVFLAGPKGKIGKLVY